jgi:hypothetical protein
MSVSPVRFFAANFGNRGTLNAGFTYFYDSYEEAVIESPSTVDVYKFKLTREQLIEWYWRVKTWRVTLDTGEAIGSYDWDWGVASEIELCQPVSALVGFDIPLISYTEDVDDSESFFQAAWFPGFRNYQLLRDDDGFFYPEFELGQDFSSWVTDTVTITGPTSFDLSGGYTIEAVEWWPYANSAGEPIWDTATGAKLRDPVTGVLL